MKAARIVVLSLLVCALLVGVIMFGCQERPASSPHMMAGRAAPAAAYRAAATHPKAHGGTDNVNDAAFDAMFFKNYGVNPFIDTDDDHLSTFAVDVDTGSYTLARSYLNRGHLPERDAVRVEEFVNYFKYDYAPPAGEEEAFAVHLAAAPSRFRQNRTLLRVGLKGREISADDRKDAVLTFIIDVSSSMAREDRLELLKKSLRLLVDQLRGGDRVGIAVYGTRGRKHMSHRGIDDRSEIVRAIDELAPSGCTNAEEGIKIGYRMAKKAFKAGAINRVVLCSDGVANVGRTGPKSILKQIEHYADKGITLSTVGFGMGNYNDVLMEQLADKGDGNYAYVDTLDEARRVFVENLTGTLQLIARDVKVQVDFNPAVVRSYRLIGYENRDVADKDFRDDKVDGGEIGAGHSVTALYELKLWPDKAGRLATVRVRHKDVEGGNVREVAHDIAASEVAGRFADADDSVKLAACAAEFAEILRKSYWARGSKLDDVLDLARQCRGRFDGRPDVKELVELIEKARRMKTAGKNGEESAAAEQ